MAQKGKEEKGEQNGGDRIENPGYGSGHTYETPGFINAVSVFHDWTYYFYPWTCVENDNIMTHYGKGGRGGEAEEGKETGTSHFLNDSYASGIFRG